MLRELTELAIFMSDLKDTVDQIKSSRRVAAAEANYIAACDKVKRTALEIKLRRQLHTAKYDAMLQDLNFG
jgi:hypothetical protein